MRLGIEFGTTHTVVAAVDRGNYPVLGFTDAAGDVVEHFPSVVAARGGQLRFGHDALAAAEQDGFTLLRSFKRLASDPGATPDLDVTIGDTTVPWIELLRGFLLSLREAILTRSNLPKRSRGKPRTGETEPPAITVAGIPANAPATQRFLTLEAFKAP